MYVLSFVSLLKPWWVLRSASKCYRSSDDCKMQCWGEKSSLSHQTLISMLFCKTRRVRLVHMPLEGVVRISQIRSAFLHKYVKVLSKCCMIYGRKALEWQPSASPSHRTVYARLVPTGVQKKKKKKGMYQMHQVSHCPSKKYLLNQWFPMCRWRPLLAY